MRIATAHAFDKSIANLQQRQQELSDTNNQMTTGKRVNVASDDPTGAARAERALASIARSEANQRSLDASRNVMNIASSAMGDAVDLLQTARETLVAAGNGSYSDGERQSLAIKLKNIRDQLLAVANRSDGSGGFVFGGQGSATPPFADTTTGVQFVGQGGESLASSSEQLNLTVDGSVAWLQAKSGNGVFTTAPGLNANTGLANTGTAWVNSGSVTNPSQVPYPAATSPAPSYSVAFHVAAGVTTYDVLQNGSAISTGQPYSSNKALPIPGAGMSVNVSGQPADGDTFTIGQSQRDLNLFSSLDKAINALNTSGGNSATVAQQAVNTGMTELDSILGNMQGAQSAVGETLNRMDGVESRIASLKLAAQTEKSNAEDLDMVQAISNFQSQQTGYDAALKSYASVQKMSLFTYLNG